MLFELIESKKKGTLIVIALKQWHEQYGQWPGSLEPLKKSLPEGIFIDSVSKQEFRYISVSNQFVLYGFGENGIDELGRDSYKYQEDRDDILIWPLSEDKLIRLLPENESSGLQPTEKVL